MGAEVNEADLVVALEASHSGRMVQLCDADHEFLFYAVEGERGLWRRRWAADGDGLATLGRRESVRPRWWGEEGRDMTHKMSAFQGKLRPDVRSRFSVHGPEDDRPIEAQAADFIALTTRWNAALGTFLGNAVTYYLRRHYLKSEEPSVASGDAGWEAAGYAPVPPEAPQLQPKSQAQGPAAQSGRESDFAEADRTGFMPVPKSKWS